MVYPAPYPGSYPYPAPYPGSYPYPAFHQAPAAVPAPVYHSPSAPPPSPVFEGGECTARISDISIYHANEDLYSTEGPLAHEALDFAMESRNAVQNYLPKTRTDYNPPTRTTELRNRSSRHQSFRSHHSTTLIIATGISVPAYRPHYRRHHSEPLPSLYGRADHRRKDEQDSSTTALFVIAGAVGAAIIAVGSYFLGSQIMTTYNKFKEAKGVAEFKKDIKEEQENYNNEDLDRFVRLSENRHKLHNSEKRWAMWKTALVATTIAAAALILVGAVVGVIPAVISGVGAPIVFAATAGAVIAVGGAILFAVGTVALFSLGIYQASVKSYRKDLAAKIDADASALVNKRIPSAVNRAGYRPTAALSVAE